VVSGQVDSPAFVVVGPAVLDDAEVDRVIADDDNNSDWLLVRELDDVDLGPEDQLN
jgi:hypothetical protein